MWPLFSTATIPNYLNIDLKNVQISHIFPNRETLIYLNKITYILNN